MYGWDVWVSQQWLDECHTGELGTRGPGRPRGGEQWTVVALLCDTGDAAAGMRGRVEIVFGPHTARTLLSLTFGKTHPVTHTGTVADATGQMVAEMQACHQRIASAISRIPTTSPTIDNVIAPLYASCGRRIVRPPCAFLAVPTPPQCGQEYYQRALHCVLARRLHLTIPDAGHRMQQFVQCVQQTYRAGGARVPASPSLFTPNELGSVLADVALFFSVGCAYLYDLVLAPYGVALVDGEEFSRLAAITKCADCEDFAFHAAMCLRELLAGTWPDAGVAALQLIRAQYVAAITIKATSGTDPATAANTPSSLATHCCCDLIPLAVLMDLAPGALVLAEMRDDRAARGLRVDPRQNRTLSVIVGEGTSRIVQYAKTDGRRMTDMDARMRTLHVLHGCGLPTARLLLANASDELWFYKYITWAAFDDTFEFAQRTATPWRLQQAAFGVQSQPAATLTCGTPHNDYLSHTNTCKLMPLPSLTPREETIIAHFEKFEHPSAVAAPPGTSDTVRYAQATTQITAWLQQSKRRSVCGAQPAVYVDVYVPLWQVTPAILDAFDASAVAIAAGLFVCDALFEHIADGMAFAVLIIGKCRS